MIFVEWTTFGLGIGVGTVMSAAFFAGLAFGMRRALRGGFAIKTLALSAALRIAMLLGVGWLVLVNAGPWAFAGYGLAFFVCRSIAVAIARVPAHAGGAE